MKVALMIDGLPLKFLKILSAESLFPELTDSARKFILDQILDSEVLNIFPDQNAQIKLGGQTVAAKLSQPASAQKLDIGQTLAGEVVRVFPDGKAQIKLEGHTLVADFKQSLEVGQAVTAKVEQLLPIPALRLMSVAGNNVPKDDRTTISQSFKTQGQSNFISSPVQETAQPLSDAELKALNLAIGQDIEGTVSSVIDDKTALIRIDDKSLAVENPSKFSPGDAVTVRVERVAGQNVLVIQLQKNENLTPIDPNIIKSYMPSKQAFGEMTGNLQKLIVGNPLLSEVKIDPSLLDSIKETLRTLLSDNPMPDENALKDRIAQSGVNYESKVKKVLTEQPENEIAHNKVELAKDLKGQLLKLAKEIENNPVETGKNLSEPSSKQNPKVAEVLQYIKQSADNIELNQLANHYAKQENQPISLQIPYPSVEEGTVKVFVNNQQGGNKKNQGEKQSFNLVFLLSMTSLGSLRVDTQVNNDRLTVKIRAESQAAVDFIDANAVGLKARLQEMGFSSDVSCCKQKKEEMQVDEGLTRLFVQDPSRLVDIKT